MKVAISCLLLCSNIATAGSLSGKVKIRANYPTHNPGSGFVKRVANPILPLKEFNPRPLMIVSLESVDGLSAPGTKSVEYKLAGESFSVPIMAVSKGQKLTIKNEGRTSPVLYCDELEWTPEALNPNRTRDGVVKTEKSFTIAVKKRPYMKGKVVIMPTSFFGLVDDKGNFKVADLPDGKWKVKVWYGAGWLSVNRVASVKGASKMDISVESFELKK